MKEILLFAGTTEGRALSEYLAEEGVKHTVCVATEYGEAVLKKHPLVTVRKGRMDQGEIRELIRTGDFAAVVDATHPYAGNITRNIREALKATEAVRGRADKGTMSVRGGTYKAAAGRTEAPEKQTAFENPVAREKAIPYLRLKREESFQKEGDLYSGKNSGQSGPVLQGRVCFFKNKEDCIEALEHTQGNILLTTGSKDLAAYCRSEQVKDRLYVRVLPGLESISLCMEQGIRGKQIIAMQGPFTAEMNEAMIRQYGISCLVTKESGVSGGFREKLAAAGRTGISAFVIGRPGEEEGLSFLETCNMLEKICGKTFHKKRRLKIILAGVGMGHESCLTNEVRSAIEEADILLGAERMLLHSKPGQECHPYYRAAQILPFLKEVQERTECMEKIKIVVLFSGDTGFYSGCQSLYAALDEEIRAEGLKASVRILPGISSVAYLAACIGESYEGAAVYSMHGKELGNLAQRIRHIPRTFLLTSGVRDVNQLGRSLIEAGLQKCHVWAGYQLSYAEHHIGRYTPEDCRGLKEEGLYTCFIKNPDAKARRLTHGLPDDAFARGKVPMTKEEVREVSICKLRLFQNAVVYDIGSGTGSAAAEIAGLSDDIRVFAIERKKEAVSLIRQNQQKFQLENMAVVEAEAPEGFRGLPAATHAFIGGSGGKLWEILETLQKVNPTMRIVINAVSMETICEIQEMLSLFRVEGAEIVQLQASRAKKAGEYHLMRAENPVWICAFEFGGE